ncbi:aldehyde dehydrogenase (NAD+) [Brevibacterium sanguinis]|uniref:Aldehyde dehydrogenase (NAD+) n=2 Tax=Brevibacterium TaxID=1696 RepID=A0A366IKS0_9MICO|nr:MULTISPECIES: aldehyde dehydrogenase family protein [Brevibacterium]RBP65085.1 aldehyde dehydrogenase (NAD+) [Brevibacterium sanguinis]RBP71348.1 aldehyde dehydrogenase (NAD+) [Brevibacterium celere]
MTVPTDTRPTVDTWLAAHLSRNFIGGEWVAAHSGATFPNRNPARPAEVIAEVADSDIDDALAAVEAARRAQAGWAGLGSIERGKILFRAAEIMDRRKEELAHVITSEQGKKLTEARSEVDRATEILRFIAGEGRRLSGSTLPADEPRSMALTWHRPLGVVALITPWNFPLAIPVWKAAPALLSGCTAVIKPSPLAPLSTAVMVEILAEAGVAPGAINLLQGDREPGEALTSHPDVRGISFTGSLPVGLRIQSAAAHRLARTQLELGGKNAVIVLADADLDAAASAIVHGAFGQAGQRCSATSRVVVESSVREDLVSRIVDRVSDMVVGDPLSADTDLGPVVDESRLTACVEAVEGAIAIGARVRAGGRPISDPSGGHYMAPTVLTEVPADSEIATEEVFGPVLSVIDAADFDEAMEISNSVRYGMSGTIFTQDRANIFDALERFEAGMLHVNRPGVGAWPHLPHMGAKLSQYGAPECSAETWEFYTELRSACIAF